MDVRSVAYPEFFAACAPRMEAHRGLLPELYRRAPLRAAAGIALDWAVIVAAVAVSEWAANPAVHLLCLLVVCSRMNALEFSWKHEATHSNLFHGRKWHARLDALYALPFCTSIAIDRLVHLDHHRRYLEQQLAPVYSYEYYGIDGERWARPAFRVWAWCVRPLLGYHSYTLVRDTAAELRAHRRLALRVLVFWVVVLAVAAATGQLRLLVEYWLVPLLVLRPPMVFWQDMAQHFGAQRSPSRDVHGALYGLLLGPHGRAHSHNLHHLYPSIPWFRQAQASALFVDDERCDVARGFVELSRQILTSADAVER